MGAFRDKVERSLGLSRWWSVVSERQSTGNPGPHLRLHVRRREFDRRHVAVPALPTRGRRSRLPLSPPSAEPESRAQRQPPSYGVSLPAEDEESCWLLLQSFCTDHIDVETPPIGLALRALVITCDRKRERSSCAPARGGLRPSFELCAAKEEIKLLIGAVVRELQQAGRHIKASTH